VFPRMRVVLDGRDPPDRPPVDPRQEILRLGVLEERVLGRGEQGADVHPQLRHPQGVAAIVVVGECDELRETAPVRDGRDLRIAQMTPSSLPRRANTSNAWSICCDVCVAIRLVRSRQCDGGTAGGTTGLVNTPASNSFRQNRNVFSSGPMSTGTIGVSVGPMSKPTDRRPVWSRRVFCHRHSRRSGSRCRMSSAASTPAVFAGGSAAVKMSGRALCCRKWMTLSEPAAKPPIHASDLEKVPTMMSTSSVRPKCAAVPSPRGPSTPTAWASSSASAAPYFCAIRSEEHTSELQSPYDLVCRLLLEKKKKLQSCMPRPRA